MRNGLVLEVGTGQSFPLVVNRGNGPDSHSLGCIHSLQVALCLVRRNGPGWGMVQAQQSGTCIP
jgi:hypothetical protein